MRLTPLPLLFLSATVLAQAPLATGVSTISLSGSGGSPMTVAYHPGFDQYYAFFGGNPTFNYYVYDSTGMQLFVSNAVGVDGRAMNYNPNTDKLELCSHFVYAPRPGQPECFCEVGLDASGFYTGMNPVLLPALPGVGTDRQTCPAYDPVGDVFYARTDTQFNRVNICDRATGASAGSIILNTAPAGSPPLASWSMGFTGVPGAELAIASPSLEAAVVFDLAGVWQGTVTLPGVDVNGSYAGNFTNGQFFVWDQTTQSWAGFEIFAAAGVDILLVNAIDSTVARGSGGYPVAVMVENLGGNAVDVTAADLTFFGTADRSAEYTVTPDPGNPMSIPALSTESLAFTVDVDAMATVEVVTLDATVSATDTVTMALYQDSSAAVTDSWDVLACVAPLCGDCNGDQSLNILDALLGAQHSAGLVVLTGSQFSNCNVTGLLEPDPGAIVDVLDALTIAQSAAGLPVFLTCC